jgi:hypothetical protein
LSAGQAGGAARSTFLDEGARHSYPGASHDAVNPAAVGDQVTESAGGSGSAARGA